MEKTEYLVDIAMPVYNHERFLAEAIEGVVNQETSFRFRLLIGEDCSKDNSRAVIREYASRYPDIIVPFYHEKNLGATGNGLFLTDRLTARYVALCEGDDYWIDKHKLQRQVDFLEANPDYTYTFTDVYVLHQLQSEHRMGDGAEYATPPDKDIVLIEDFVMATRNFAFTPSVVFRNLLPRPVPPFYHKLVSVDLFIQMFLADKGKARRFREKTAVYRDHNGGITKQADNIATGDAQLAYLYEQMDGYLEGRHHHLFRQKLLQMARINLIYGARDKKGAAKWKHYRKSLPEYLKYTDKINIKELLYYHMILFFPSLLKAAGKKN